MSRKILVVDDDPDIVAVTEARLKLSGYDVHTAVNGLEGLEIARQLKPDLVILDIIMPEMDGFTLYNELKKDEEIAHIPIVILTALARLEDPFRAMGVEEFIAKPISPHDLVIKVENILNRP